VSQCRYSGQPNRQDDGKGGPAGFDGAKKIKGRKRSLLVDTLGLILDLWVHPADLSDSAAGQELLIDATERFPRLERVYADSAYASMAPGGTAAAAVTVEIVKRPEGTDGFLVLAKRWIVERTFGWFGRYRRLARDYEASCESSEDLIYAAMINRMLHLLCPG
jgi:putative transposase